MIKKRNIAIGITAAVVIAGVTVTVIMTRPKSKTPTTITSTEIIPCKDRVSATSTSSNVDMSGVTCVGTVDIKLNIAKKSPNMVVNIRRNGVLIATTNESTMIDVKLSTGKTYQYSISDGDSNVWSSEVAVTVPTYATLCETFGLENLNGVCVNPCKPDSVRDPNSGFCMCKDLYAVHNADDICVCNSPHFELVNGIRCEPVCEPNFERDKAGNCVCKPGTDCIPCPAGYAGPGCIYSDALTCKGHGTVQNNGMCMCEPEYSGPNCGLLVECLSSVFSKVEPFSNVAWNIFHQGFRRTFKPSGDYTFTLDIANQDSSGYQWYVSNVTTSFESITLPVVEVGLKEVSGGVNLKFRGLYNDTYGADNATLINTYYPMFSSDTPAFSVTSIPSFRLTYKIGTSGTVYSPVVNKNGLITMKSDPVSEIREEFPIPHMWFDSVQLYKTPYGNASSVMIGLRPISLTQVNIVFVFYIYLVPYVADSTETIIEYPERIIPSRLSRFRTQEYTLTMADGRVTFPQTTVNLQQIAYTVQRNFTIDGFTLELTLPPTVPIYSYTNPKELFISTVDKTNANGCFELVSIDLTNNVRGINGANVVGLKLNRDSPSVLKRWACTGTACVQTASSDTTTTYATESECKCNVCVNGACAAAVNVKGTLASCESLSCVTSLSGNYETAGKDPQGLYMRSTLAPVLPTIADLSSFPLKVLSLQNVVSAAGLPVVSSTGEVKFAPTPCFVYYPMFIFKANKKVVTLNSGGAQIRMVGGTAGGCELEVVLVPWGNHTPNAPDPVIFPSTQVRTINAAGTTVTVPNSTPVFANAGSSKYGVRGSFSAFAPGFTNIKATITPGLQYAIAIQATIATDEWITMTWEPFSPLVKAVVFSDI